MQTIGSAVTQGNSGYGSERDFDERFEAQRLRLLAVCRSLVGESFAEDVVHDTYLKGRTAYRRLRSPTSFEAWIARIAVNQCYNYFRARRRLIDRLPQLARPPEDSGERDLGLRELIERLRPRERTLIVLHYGYGYHIDEIAALLRVSNTNARSILFRTRLKLAQQLREATQ